MNLQQRKLTCDLFKYYALFNSSALRDCGGQRDVEENAQGLWLLILYKMLLFLQPARDDETTLV